jgi:protein phosphatase
LLHEAKCAETPRVAAVPSSHAVRVEIAGVTDVGRLRRRNEDAIDWDTGLGMAIVADGMGGNQAGNVASATAIRSIKADIRRAFADSASHGPRAVLKEVRSALVTELIRRANRDLRRLAARDNRLSGMGTTIALALAGPDYLTVAHVGDSRVYRLRGRALVRLTEDHSMVQELVERGEMNAQEAATSKHRNVITRALGIAHDVMVDVAHHVTLTNDVFMLCSDGLTNMVPEQEIETMLARGCADLGVSAREIIAAANARGGRDNISVVLMRILGVSHG